MHALRSTTLAVLLAPLSAQAVSVEFSPNPPSQGALVTIVGTDQTGRGVTLPSPCTWVRIHQGSQAGPVVGPNGFCPAVLVPIPPNASFRLQWDQLDGNGRPLPAGDYWFETRVWDPSLSNLMVDWFCLRVMPPQSTDPLLRAAGQAQIGQVTQLALASPAHGNGVFFLAASLSSNNPVQAFGLQTCLSQPITADLFLPAFGPLDPSGASPSIGMAIPNLPAIRFWGLQVQALVSDLALANPQLTNPQSFTIR